MMLSAQNSKMHFNSIGLFELRYAYRKYIDTLCTQRLTYCCRPSWRQRRYRRSSVCWWSSAAGRWDYHKQVRKTGEEGRRRHRTTRRDCHSTSNTIASTSLMLTDFVFLHECSCSVYYTNSVFQVFSQFYAGTHCIPTEGWPGWVDLGGCCNMQRRLPIPALTGLDV